MKTCNDIKQKEEDRCSGGLTAVAIPKMGADLPEIDSGYGANFGTVTLAERKVILNYSFLSLKGH